MNINERIQSFKQRKQDALHEVFVKYDLAEEHLAEALGEDLGLSAMGYHTFAISAKGELMISGYGKGVGQLCELFDNPSLTYGKSKYCGHYTQINGTYMNVPVTATVYDHV